MAAAVATGVVALEFDANQNQMQAPLTPNSAKGILEYTAVKIANTDALSQGNGQINAAGAETLAGSINTTVPTGQWWLATGVMPVSYIGGRPYTWAQNIIWGTSYIGGRFMFVKGLMWDDNIIWGTGVVHGKDGRGKTLIAGSSHIKLNGKFVDDNIIWGTNVTVYRKSIVFGKSSDDNIIWGKIGRAHV